MIAISSLPPTERFAHIMAFAGQALAARSKGGIVPGLWIVVIWQRMSRMGTRFASLTARFRSGALPRAPRLPSLAPVERMPAAPRTVGVRGPRLLPTGHLDRLPEGVARRSGWLVRLAPETAVCSVWLRELVAEPEVMAMAAASPLMARTLRSSCWMLGVDARAALPPRAPGRRMVAKEPAAPRRKRETVQRVPGGPYDYPQHLPPFPAGPEPAPKRRGRKMPAPRTGSVAAEMTTPK